MSTTKYTREDESFRGLLKELRMERQLTQAQTAERLGVPQSYVSKYETGERSLDFVETALVCRALGITLEEFARLFTSRTGKPEERKKAASR